MHNFRILNYGSRIHQPPSKKQRCLEKKFDDKKEMIDFLKDIVWNIESVD